MMAGISMTWATRETAAAVFYMTATGIVTALALVLFFFPRGKSRKSFFPTASLACISLAAATLAQADWEHTETDWPDKSRIWAAQITEVGKRAPGSIIADARLTHATRDKNGKKVRLKLEGEKTDKLQAGDEVVLSSRIGKAWSAGNPGDFDYHTYLLTHGISGTAFAGEGSWDILKENAGKGLATFFLRLREKLTEQYARHFEKEQSSVLSALTLGDRTELGADTRRLFSDSGTSHIIALSGLHLGILFAILNMALLRWMPGRKAYAVACLSAIPCLWLFVLLAGSPLSLIRSAWMFTLLQVGACLRGDTGGTLNNLSFSAIALLCVSPLALFDVSFQMSFSAVAGIVLTGQYVWSRFPLPEWGNPFQESATKLKHRFGSKGFFKNKGKTGLRRCYDLFRSKIWIFITTSISAQLGTAPFVLYYFHTVSPYVLLANFIVIPAAYVLLGGSLLFFLLPFPFFRDTTTLVMRTTLRLMTSGLDSMGHWPYARITLYPTLPTLLSIVAVPCLAYAFMQVRYRRKRIRITIVCTLLIAASIGAETYRLRPARIEPQVAIYNIPRATVIHFISSARRSAIYSSVPADTLWERMQYVEKNFFAPHHIARPEFLVKEHFRKDDLLREGCFFIFRGKSLFLLHTDVQNAASGPPLVVDVLVVSRGCHDLPETVSRTLRPRQIVLDRTLPHYLRERWKNNCKATGLACHDIQSDGAFIFPLSKQSP